MYLNMFKLLDMTNVKASLEHTIFLVLTGGAGEFVEISKRKWINAYQKLDDDDEDLANQCFKKLDEYPIQPELINDELPAMVKGLDNFLCHEYSPTGPATLPSFR